jgi:hypothetical protein
LEPAEPPIIFRKLDEAVDGLERMKQKTKKIVPASEKTVDKLKTEIKGIRDRALIDAEARVYADRIAKGMPTVTKGIISAIAAFDKHDYITGSSALMDICSGAAILLPPPVGPVVGAFFTSIGQILGYFVQHESSLEDKIEKLLDHLQSEQRIADITAVGHSISSYTTSLIARCVDTPSSKGIAEILAMPLTSETQADGFIVEMEGLITGLKHDKEKFNVPAFANWQVAGYLERSKNWQTQGWPEVLGIWCRTYIDLLTTNMMLNCLVNQNTLDRLINETQADNQNLPNLQLQTKRKCHDALLSLKSLVKELRKSWESDKKEMLKIVQAVRPAARERGMYAHLGYWDVADGNILYTASGSGSKDALKWDYQRDTAELKRISIHIPNAEKDSFTPKYEVFTCEYGNNIGSHTLDSVTNKLSKRTQVIQGNVKKDATLEEERFVDVSAMGLIDPPSGPLNPTIPSTQPKAVTFVRLIIEKIHSTPRNTRMNLYEIDENNKSTKVWWPGTAGFVADMYVAGANTDKLYTNTDNRMWVRDLYLPPTTLPDDPDADAMVDDNANPPGPPLLAQKKYSFLSYAGVADGNKIYVGTTSNQTTNQTTYGAVEGPAWTSYNGIEVDPNYLWVFGKGGIACATHTSIIKCRQGKVASPSWIYHDIGNQFPSKLEVTSLCPCADGTLVANIQGNIYTADYEIEPTVIHSPLSFTPGRIVTSSWVKRGGNAKQVIKMPIPCWSMLEKLRENLQQPSYEN